MTDFFAFSDTHGQHRKLQVPTDARIVICAGDAVEDNLKGDEYDDFIAWFGALPAKWKLFVSRFQRACLVSELYGFSQNPIRRRF